MHLGECPGGEAFDTESVRHTGGVGREVPDGGLVADVGVDHHRLDGEPLWRGTVRGGWLGVGLFFTLSGYLIIGLIDAELAATGRFRLGHFMARRIRRLLPAALVTVVGVGQFHRSVHGSGHDDRCQHEDQTGETAGSIIAPCTTRTTRAIRAGMATSTEPIEQVQNILQVVSGLGLQPYALPKPLPEISADDVHLVCWVALVS